MKSYNCIGGGGIHLEATNDLDEVMKRIPSEIAHYKRSQPASTNVYVTIHVDGVFTEQLKFNKGSPSGKADIKAVRYKFGLEEKQFKVSKVRVNRTFFAQVTLDFEYELGKCEGDDVTKDIKDQLDELNAKGFVRVKDIVLEEAEEIERKRTRKIKIDPQVPLELDGVFVQPLEFKRDSKDGQKAIAAVCKKLGVDHVNFDLTQVKHVRYFFINVSVDHSPMLKKQKSETVADGLKGLVTKLKNGGLKIRGMEDLHDELMTYAA